MNRPLVWLAFFVCASPLYAQKVGDELIVVAPSEAKLTVDARGTSGDYSDAVAYYSEAIRLNAKDANLYYARGAAYQHQGDEDKAIADYTQAIRLNPKLANAYWGRGAAYGAKGDYDKAIADCSEAIRLNPKEAGSYYNRGYAYGVKGDWDKAVADYTEAIRLEPKDARCYLGRSWVYDRKGDAAKAIADLDAANKLEPHSPYYYERRAIVWIGHGDYEKGTQDLQAAIRLNPKDLAAKFEAWPKPPLSAEALEHGRRQVAQMLGDRPPMAQHGQKAERLYQWAARKFAGEDLQQQIFWSSIDPPEPFEANHHPPAEGEPGLIRLRLKYSQGPDRGKLRSFEEMWSNAVYELYNITGVKDFRRANADAARGELSKEQYVTRYMAIESRAAEKTRAFYIHVFLPWAKEHRVATHPDRWFLGCWRDQGQDLLSPSAAKGNVYWRSYEGFYDGIVLKSLIKRGKGQQAAKLAAEMLGSAKTDNEKADTYHRRAYAYAMSGELDEAIADYSAAIRLNPKDARLYHGRAYAYAKRGELDKVIADCTEAIRLDPKMAAPHGNRGMAYMKKGDCNKAIADFTEALRLDPKDEKAYWYRARAYAKKGDKAKAEADFAQANKLGYKTERAAEPESQKQPEIANSIGMKLVPIPAGEFMMGGTETAEELVKAFAAYHRKPEFFKDEYPRHHVRITRPLYFGKYEVTVGQFRRFVDAAGYKTEAERDGAGGWGYNPTTGKCEGRNPKYNWRNPGFKQTDDYPVLDVTWNDAVAFCRWLSRKEGKTYRLPTEAEWEYAARAGTDTRYSNGDDPAALAKVGNVNDAKGRTTFPHVQELDIPPTSHPRFTVPVGQFPPNRFGLCDVHGNVWEWCSDWYGEDYYARSLVDDPQGPDSGDRRVRRGGGWNSFPLWARASFRNWNTPVSRCVNLGFRVVLATSGASVPCGAGVSPALAAGVAAPQHRAGETPAPQDDAVKIIFGGDVMLDGGPGHAITNGRDPFAEFASLLRGADVAVCNLECVLARGGRQVLKPYTFRGPTQAVPLLKQYFTAVSVANNHTGDFGPEAVAGQLTMFDEAHLPCFGGGRDSREARRPLILERKGLRIAPLGRNGFPPKSFAAGEKRPGVAWINDDDVVADVRAARGRDRADIVIPFLHWGIEGTPNPTDGQRQLARRLIDAGATAVVGAHPHVTQTVEIYKGRPIVYSLGNFVFDYYPGDPPVWTGWLAQFTVRRSGEIDLETFVLQIDLAGIPHLLPAAKRSTTAGVTRTGGG